MSSFDLFEEDEGGLARARLTHQMISDIRERLGVLLDFLPVGLLIHTEQGILYANPGAEALLHASSGQLLGQHVFDFVGSEDLASVRRTFDAAFGEPATGHVEAMVVSGDGSQRIADVVIGKMPWEGNPVLLVILRDVTDQKQAEASLRQLAITDELTGAFNRRHAFYEGGVYVEQASSGNLALSVLMLDIDHFKQVNDRYGHSTGDAALVGFSHAIMDLLPTFRDVNSSMLARLGGEEFAVLLPGVALERAASIAESLRRKVEQLPISTADGPITITVSIGVASHHIGESFERLLARADAALYGSKSGGRNRVTVCRRHAEHSSIQLSASSA